MYANILLSTDGSDVARKGVKHGIALAKALNAKATVITVTEPLPVDYGSGHVDSSPRIGAERPNALPAQPRRSAHVQQVRRNRRKH